MTTFSRRALLVRGAQLCMAGSALTLAGCDQQQAAGAVTCVDPKALEPGEAALRNSLRYTDTSANPELICAQCAFFHPPQQGSCGTCDIFHAGPASAAGHCDSWSRRS